MSQKATCVPAEYWTPQLLLLCAKHVWGQTVLFIDVQLLMSPS